MKINHKRLFLHSLRSALLFVASFLIYDILATLKKSWNPDDELRLFYLHKALKFTLILTTDLCILYAITIVFGIDL